MPDDFWDQLTAELAVLDRDRPLTTSLGRSRGDGDVPSAIDLATSTATAPVLTHLPPPPCPTEAATGAMAPSGDDAVIDLRDRPAPPRLVAADRPAPPDVIDLRDRPAPPAGVAPWPEPIRVRSRRRHATRHPLPAGPTTAPAVVDLVDAARRAGRVPAAR